MTEYLTLFNQMHLGAISSQHGLKLKDLRYEAQFSKVWLAAGYHMQSLV